MLNPMLRVELESKIHDKKSTRWPFLHYYYRAQTLREFSGVLCRGVARGSSRRLTPLLFL